MAEESDGERSLLLPSFLISVPLLTMLRKSGLWERSEQKEGEGKNLWHFSEHAAQGNNLLM